MRRQLVGVALAVTSLVALAFAIPLGLLVRDVARDRALSAAERDMAALAPVLALTTDPGLIHTALGRTATGAAGRLTVWANGQAIGDPTSADPDQVALVQERRLAFSAELATGMALYQPVVTGEGAVAVIRARVPTELMDVGVPVAWTALLSVAGVLVVGAVVIADQLGRTVVRPTRQLAGVARRLGQGELDSRAPTAGPPEIAEAAGALNFLARRIQELLAGERERVADLSHRLRTPLTAVRLEAESVGSAELVSRLDRLEAAVSELISDARRPLRPEGPRSCDLAEVVRARVEFWAALGEEQGRPWSCRFDPEGPHPVRLSQEEAVAALDALLGNVFAHTPEGTAYRVTLQRRGSRTALVVEDAGPGIADAAAVLERGHSHAGSTGLGLDIARRSAQEAGGRLTLERGARGGARVGLVLPLDAPLSGERVTPRSRPRLGRTSPG